jgi:hypothetical protein
MPIRCEKERTRTILEPENSVSNFYKKTLNCYKVGHYILMHPVVLVKLSRAKDTVQVVELQHKGPYLDTVEKFHLYKKQIKRKLSI